MKNATTCATRLTALLKDLPTAELPEFPDHEDPVAVLVFSALMLVPCSLTASVRTTATP